MVGYKWKLYIYFHSFISSKYFLLYNRAGAMVDKREREREGQGGVLYFCMLVIVVFLCGRQEMEILKS